MHKINKKYEYDPNKYSSYKSQTPIVVKKIDFRNYDTNLPQIKSSERFKNCKNDNINHEINNKYINLPNDTEIIYYDDHPIQSANDVFINYKDKEKENTNKDVRSASTESKPHILKNNKNYYNELYSFKNKFKSVVNSNGVNIELISEKVLKINENENNENEVQSLPSNGVVIKSETIAQSKRANVLDKFDKQVSGNSHKINLMSPNPANLKSRNIINNFIPCKTPMINRDRSILDYMKNKRNTHSIDRPKAHCKIEANLKAVRKFSSTFYDYDAKDIKWDNNTLKLRTFMVDPSFIALKYYLEKLGLKETTQETVFDFSYKLGKFNKFVYPTLKSSQLISMFKGVCITTKSGLSKQLRSYASKTKTDVELFFPKCFDCSEQPEVDQFVQAYTAHVALKFLRVHLKPSYVKFLTTRFNKDDIRAIKNFCLEIVSNFFIKKLRMVREFDILHTFVHLGIEPELSLQCQEYLDKRRSNYWIEKNSGSHSTTRFVITLQSPTELEVAAKSALVEEQLAEVAQTNLNNGHNIWIMKPSGKSKGIGIAVKTSLDSIVKTILSNQENYIVQKYIENNLLYAKRKFDIRVWVLLVSVSPLRAYIFEDWYLRLTSRDYDIEKEDLLNHLTNNSVQSNAIDFETNSIAGCMVTKKEFLDYIEKTCRHLAETPSAHVCAQIERVVGCVLKAGLETIHNRPNTFETFGFDFMVDSSLNVQLIECNRSPDLSFSTPVTTELVQKYFKDLAHLFVTKDMSKVIKGKVDQVGSLKLLKFK